MLAEITTEDFDEWTALQIIEPQGEERADLRMIQICMSFARTMGAEIDVPQWPPWEHQEEIEGEQTEEELAEQIDEETKALQRLSGAK